MKKLCHSIAGCCYCVSVLRCLVSMKVIFLISLAFFSLLCVFLYDPTFPLFSYSFFHKLTSICGNSWRYAVHAVNVTLCLVPYCWLYIRCSLAAGIKLTYCQRTCMRQKKTSLTHFPSTSIHYYYEHRIYCTIG